MQRKVNIIFLVFLWAVVMAASAHSAEWRWNGYFGANYEDDTRQNQSGGFDTYVLSLISNIKIDENLRLVGQVDWEHAPYIDFSSDSTGTKSLDQRTSGEVTLSNAYGQYTVAEYLKISAGKFFVPVGIYNQIFYAVPTFPTLKTPQESVYKRSGSTDKDATFFQRYAQGVWLNGDAGLLAYDVYLTNGRTFRQHVDDNTNKSVGGRLKLNLLVRDVGITPLVSYYQDKYSVPATTPTQTKKQTSFIPGIEVTAGDLVVRGEYASSTIKNVNASGETDFSAYYAEAYYTIAEKFTPYLRYELYEPNKDVADDKETETTVGVSYHIIPWVAQVKAQVKFHDYEKEISPTATSSGKQAYNVYGIGLALGF